MPRVSPIRWSSQNCRLSSAIIKLDSRQRFSAVVTCFLMPVNLHSTPFSLLGVPYLFTPGIPPPKVIVTPNLLTASSTQSNLALL
jgi:hypothetical protein